MRDSDLLFPAKSGGFRTSSVLTKVFDDVRGKLGLTKRITARAMRRSFQDLAREANIDAIVQRSICGHATAEMSELYSTVGQREIQRAVGKVISMAGYRQLTPTAEQPGYALGLHDKNSPTDGREKSARQQSESSLTR